MSFETILLDCILTAVMPVCVKKKGLTKIEFLCRCFNIDDGRRNATFSVYYALSISRKVKTQVKQEERFLQYMEKVLWLMEHVKSTLWSFLVLLTFWPHSSLLWGCLMHWKMFSSTPGLCPLEANSGREPTYSKYPNQYSYWWKWKLCLLFYGENIADFLANSIYTRSAQKDKI